MPPLQPQKPGFDGPQSHPYPSIPERRRTLAQRPRLTLLVKSQWHLTFSGNNGLYPGGIINGVQVLFTKIGGYRHDHVAAHEFRSEPLYGREDCSSASSDEQVKIANERKTGFNRFFFGHRYDIVGVGQVSELRPHTRADTRNVSLRGCASEG